MAQITVSPNIQIDGGFGSGLQVRAGERSASAEPLFEDARFGGREGDYMEPRCVLWFTDQHGRSGAGVWALPAWIIAELVR